MADATVVPVEESKETKAEEKEVKAGEVLETTKEDKREPKMVPEAALIEYKKENKQLVKEIKQLIESGAAKKEVAADLKTLADEYGVEPKMVEGITAAVRQQIEGEFEKKDAPVKAKALAAEKDKIFEEHFAKTLEENPEYARLVNKDTIKSMAFDPTNANKTFAQIFQAAYGHLVTGKKTLEPTKPRGGAKDTDIDLSKPINDSEKFAEIMADPELKAKYNEEMLKRLKI